MSELDHVVVLVEDLDVSAEALEAVGFYVTARADHPFGTSNRLIMLDNAYIELMTVTDPDRVPEAGFARYSLESLATGRLGPRLLSFGTDEPEADRGRLLNAGLDVAPPIRFGRLAHLPDGSSEEVEFIVVIPEFGDIEVASFLCQHLHRDTVWHPSTRDHPNGADLLTEVRVSGAGAAEWERMEIVTGTEGPPFDLDNVFIAEGEPRLVVRGRESSSTQFDGTTVEVVAP